MSKFYTTKGDDGFTGLLGEGRVPKYDRRLEAMGAADEASAVLGVARSLTNSPATAALILKVQRDLYGLMAELAATPENAARFRVIDSERVAWLEAEADTMAGQVEMPREFIVPGDSQAGAALALARTVVRRAERQAAFLLHDGQIENGELLRYLNRLSSLCFALELVENQAAGGQPQTMAKTQE